MPVPEWFDRFYPVPASERETLERVLTALGSEIGIDWTQLRPPDTFESMLRIAPQYAPEGDLDDVETEVLNLLPGAKLESLPAMQGTLADFLDAVRCARGR